MTFAGAADCHASETSKRQKLLRQREYGQRTAQLGVITELFVSADRTQAFGPLLGIESRSHADAGPAADAGEHAEVLLALVLIGKNIADDARRRLELEQLLVDVVRIDALQIALKRSIARDSARRREHAAPHGELLGLRLDDLAGARVPCGARAHRVAARRRKHRQRSAHK